MRIIRAVIDTNIFVSGVISSKGAHRRILDLARKEKFKVVTSISIFWNLFQYSIIVAQSFAANSA